VDSTHRFPSAQRTLHLPAANWHSHAITHYLLGRGTDIPVEAERGNRLRWAEQFPEDIRNHPDITYAGRCYGVIADDVHHEIIYAITGTVDKPTWFACPRLESSNPAAYERRLGSPRT